MRDFDISLVSRNICCCDLRGFSLIHLCVNYCYLLMLRLPEEGEKVNWRSLRAAFREGEEVKMVQLFPPGVMNTRGPVPVTCRYVLCLSHCLRDLPIMCSLTMSWSPTREEDERA